MTDKPLFKVGDRIGTLRVLEVVQLPGIPERCYRCEFEDYPGSRPGLVWESQLLLDSGAEKTTAAEEQPTRAMPDDLRTLIETTLAQAGGLCLDEPADRATLAGLLLGALRPLDIEQHPTAWDAEIARLTEERDAARAELSEYKVGLKTIVNLSAIAACKDAALDEDAALRREVAELSGWRVSYAESDDLGDWYDFVDPGGNILAVTRAPDDDTAWDELIHELPDWPGNPTDALMLMTGDLLEWHSNTVASGHRLWIEHVCSSARFNPRIEGRSRVEVEVLGGYAHALARAVTKAWVQWKRQMQSAARAIEARP